MFFLLRKKRLIGQYRIIDYIGEGRFGQCFLAEGPSGKLVLKRFKFKISTKNRPACQFEGKILSKLNHPNIPRFISFVNEQGFSGIALEQKQGQTIETMLFKHKHCFSRSEIYSIGKQLIAIIKYLHEQGIVHRDIRVSNILIDGGIVCLVDFGLARYANSTEYTRDIDFFYLGDILLHLLYSSHHNPSRRRIPWYKELTLTFADQLFLKRLLKLADPYTDIEEIAVDFEEIFFC